MSSLLNHEPHTMHGAPLQAVAGFYATLIMLSLMFLCRVTLGTLFVPELLADRLFARPPISLVEFGISILGAYAKKTGFVGCVLVFIAMGTSVGALAFRLMPDLPERPIQFGLFLHATTGWYISLSAAIPGFAWGIITSIPAQLAVPIITLLVIYVVYSLSLGPLLVWLSRAPKNKNLQMASRRCTILSLLGVTAVGSFIYTGVEAFVCVSG